MMGRGRSSNPRGPFGSCVSAGITVGLPLAFAALVHRAPPGSFLELEQTCFQGLSIVMRARTRARPDPTVAHEVRTAVSFVSVLLSQLGVSSIVAGTVLAALQSLSIRALKVKPPRVWPPPDVSMWLAVVPLNQFVKPLASPEPPALRTWSRAQSRPASALASAWASDL